jgi:photosystem II stability/assembly factor-like uncharacterized protein
VIRLGERVQVMNPHPMKCGTVRSRPRWGHGLPWVLVRWDDGGETWSRVDLLAEVLDGSPR